MPGPIVKNDYRIFDNYTKLSINEAKTELLKSYLFVYGSKEYNALIDKEKITYLLEQFNNMSINFTLDAYLICSVIIKNIIYINPDQTEKLFRILTLWNNIYPYYKIDINNII